MDIQEEVVSVSKDNQGSLQIKRKRTRRGRISTSPGLALTMATTSSCSNVGDHGGGSDFSGEVDRAVAASASASVSAALPCNSGELHSTEEEEDMANCLILLARGRVGKTQETIFATSTTTASAAVTATTTNKTALGDVYECKTCNRRFPSFQALGGHRASHKKPKVIPPLEDQKKPFGLGLSSLNSQQEINVVRFNDVKNNVTSTALSLQIPDGSTCGQTNKTRVHECSICGAEFTSGQALGGHMRRHRPIPITNAAVAAGTTAAATTSREDSQETKKPRNILSLDLNLPAPEDDHHIRESSKFPFASKEKVIVFSTSPLVDCHY